MKRFKKLGAIIFLSAYLIIGASLVIPGESLAAAPEFTPQIGIPGSNFQPGTGNVIGSEVKNVTTGETVMRSDLIGRYVLAFYNWGFSIVGVVAVLMLMAAGLIWLTSGGDSGKIGNAKKMIGGSLLGSLLLVGSWFLLNTINPNLTNLPTIDMAIISKVAMGCCDISGKAEMTTGNVCEKKKGVFDENKVLGSSGQCEPMVCCTITYSNPAYQTHCYKTNKENCIEGTTTEGQCANIDKCKNGVIMGCGGVKTGEAPNDSKDYITNAFCYNDLVYRRQGSLGGRLGEPCGSEPYSKCDKDQAQNGKNCVRGSGGRNCESGLWCCQFNADGTRINQ